jgi:hypothetical protein
LEKDEGKLSELCRSRDNACKDVSCEGKREWVVHLSSAVLQFPKDLFGKHKTANPKEYSKLMQKSMQDIDK